MSSTRVTRSSRATQPEISSKTEEISVQKKGKGKPKAVLASDLETSGDEDFVDNLPQVALAELKVKKGQKTARAKNNKEQQEESQNEDNEVMVTSPRIKRKSGAKNKSSTQKRGRTASKVPKTAESVVEDIDHMVLSTPAKPHAILDKESDSDKENVPPEVSEATQGKARGKRMGTTLGKTSTLKKVPLKDAKRKTVLAKNMEEEHEETMEVDAKYGTPHKDLENGSDIHMSTVTPRRTAPRKEMTNDSDAEVMDSTPIRASRIIKFKPVRSSDTESHDEYNISSPTHSEQVVNSPRKSISGNFVRDSESPSPKKDTGRTSKRMPSIAEDAEDVSRETPRKKPRHGSYTKPTSDASNNMFLSADNNSVEACNQDEEAMEDITEDINNLSDDEFYGMSAQQSMFMDGAWSFKLAPFHKNSPKIKKHPTYSYPSELLASNFDDCLGTCGIVSTVTTRCLISLVVAAHPAEYLHNIACCNPGDYVKDLFSTVCHMTNGSKKKTPLISFGMVQETSALQEIPEINRPRTLNLRMLSVQLERTWSAITTILGAQGLQTYSPRGEILFQGGYNKSDTKQGVPNNTLDFKVLRKKHDEFLARYSPQQKTSWELQNYLEKVCNGKTSALPYTVQIPIFDARPYFDPAAKTHLNPREFKISSVATTCTLYEEELPGEAFVAVIYSANSWKKKEPSKENSFDFPNISMNLYAVVLLALPSS